MKFFFFNCVYVLLFMFCSESYICAQVCLGNKCVDISVYGKKEDCAKKCNNNGVSELEITSLCSVCVQVQVLDSCRNTFYCILSFRCAITRTSVTVILAGLHLTVTSNMQICLKVQNKMLDLILSQLM